MYNPTHTVTFCKNWDIVVVVVQNVWRNFCPIIQFSLVTQSYPTLCDPMNCSTPGLPVHHQLPEFTHTHVHQVSDSIQPSHLRWRWDLLAVQGTLKSLLQHHSSKASILLHSAFFTVQLSHPYMTTGKTIALTKWTFVGNVSAFQCAI